MCLQGCSEVTELKPKFSQQWKQIERRSLAHSKGLGEAFTIHTAKFGCDLQISVGLNYKLVPQYTYYYYYYYYYNYYNR